MSLGLADRAVSVLNALLTFLPETALAPGEGPELVVFPSNAALALRAHGIAEATLRRHLGSLIEAGIIIRRDSPNGKRYARRGQGGSITHAFGFDLTPLVARAEEFAELACAVRTEAEALRIAREQVTLLRRDCMKLIQALEDAEGGTAVPLRERLHAVVAELRGVPALDDACRAVTALEALASDVGNLLVDQQENEDMSGNAAQNDRHIQSSNPKTPVYETASEQSEKVLIRSSPPRSGVEMARSERDRTYPLDMVLDACPDITEFAPGGIRSWSDLSEAANLARSALGISRDAWSDAIGAMGADTAAVTVAAILQRADHIKSPGGYLRSLAGRKRTGEFSLGPVIQALMRTQLKGLGNAIRAG